MTLLVFRSLVHLAKCSVPEFDVAETSPTGDYVTYTWIRQAGNYHAQFSTDSPVVLAFRESKDAAPIVLNDHAFLNAVNREWTVNVERGDDDLVVLSTRVDGKARTCRTKAQTPQELQTEIARFKRTIRGW